MQSISLDLGLAEPNPGQQAETGLDLYLSGQGF